MKTIHNTIINACIMGFGVILLPVTVMASENNERQKYEMKDDLSTSTPVFQIIQKKSEMEDVFNLADANLTNLTTALLDAFIKASVTPAQEDRVAEKKQTSDGETLTQTIEHVRSFARDYEEVYHRFIHGKLIFDDNFGQRKDFDFLQFATTLDGEFNLNGLQHRIDGHIFNVNDFLRIKIGYRKSMEYEDKTTIWIVPNFFILSSNFFSTVKRTSPVGIFWTWGTHQLTDFDYLTSMPFDEISSQNLYDLTRCRCACIDGLPLLVHTVKHFKLKF